MTLNGIISLSGLRLTQNQKGLVGTEIVKRARELKVKISKKPEFILVNDYPEEFREEMETIIIEFLLKNKGTVAG